MDDPKTIRGGVVNISDIIQSISTINNGVITIINSLTKDMSKLNDIDTKSLSNNISVVSKITDSMTSYMVEIDRLLTTIITSKNINTNSINTILDYYETVDPKNPNKIIKSEMKLLSSLSLVSKFIIDISKSIDDISKLKLPLQSSISVRKNLFILSNNINLIVDDIINLFQNQDRSKELKGVLDVITPTPETIELINDVQKNIDESGSGGDHKLIDKSYDKTRTITTKANLGILDIISIYLNFAKTLSDLSIPNPISLRIKLLLLNKNVSKVIDDILILTPTLGNKEQANAFSMMNKSLVEIEKVLKSMTTILNPISELSIKILMIYSVSIKALDKLVGVDEYIVDKKGNRWIQHIIDKSKDKKSKIGILTKLLAIKYFIEENWSKINKNSVTNISSFVSSLVNIITSVTILSLLSLNPIIGIGLNRLLSDKILGALISLAERINSKKLDILDDKDFKTRLDNLIKFVDSIKKLTTSILITSVLAIIAIPAMLVVSLFMVSLIPFIIIVSLITKFISKLNIGDVKDSILNIMLVCGLFVLVAVELVLLQIVLERIEWSSLSINLLCLLGVVVVLTLITLGLYYLFSKVKGNIISSVITIIAVTGLFLIVGVTLLALQYILAPIEWLSLLGGLVGLTLVTVALAGVCVLIGMSSIVFIAAIAGIVIMLATVSSIFLIAVMLKTLTLISFSKEDIKKLTAKPEDNEKGEYGVLTAVIRVIKSIGDLLDESDFLNLGTLALVTIKFFIMTFTIGLVFIIALLLEAITEITLNVGVWNPTTTVTDGTILGNISAVINTVGLINHHMTQPPVDENGNPVEQDKGLLGTIIGWISPELANVISSLLNFATLILTLMNVGCIYLIARILMSISELEVDEGVIMGKIDSIINIVKHISDKLLYNEDKPEAKAAPPKEENIVKRGLNKLKSFGQSIVGAAENLLSAGILATTLPNVLMLGQVVDVLNAINEVKVDEGSLTKKIDSIISIVSKVSAQVSKDSKIATIDEDNVEAFEDFTDSNIKLYKGINDLNVDKVTSLTKLYSQMTEFMNSLKDLDIDEITEVLVHKIGPALSDIKDELSGEPKEDKSFIQKAKEKVQGTINKDKEQKSTSPKESTEAKETSQQKQGNTEDFKEIVQQLQVIINTLKNEGVIIQNLS